MISDFFPLLWPCSLELYPNNSKRTGPGKGYQGMYIYLKELKPILSQKLLIYSVPRYVYLNQKMVIGKKYLVMFQFLMFSQVFTSLCYQNMYKLHVNT